jgi:cytochrome c peroxidase
LTPLGRVGNPTPIVPLSRDENNQFARRRAIGILASSAVGILHSGAWSQPAADEELIEKGRRLFLEETFDGNGRTCGTCHPPSNNFTLDPAFIRTLPGNDPLFVAQPSGPQLSALEVRQLLQTSP